MNKQRKILLCFAMVLLMALCVVGITSFAADSSAATVSVYKQVDYETDKVVDLKYYEFIGTAEDVETAAKLINASGANGGLIEISEGTLTVTTRQDITKQQTPNVVNIVIKGAGKDKTTIVGDASRFNSTTNGLKSSSLSSEYKAILGLDIENVKVMDLTVSAGDCGYASGSFVKTPADLKTVRVNSGTAYFENVKISGKTVRSNLLIGSSTSSATVIAVGVTVDKPTYYLGYGSATEKTSGTLNSVNSYLGGAVIGECDSLGAGYYRLSYGGVVAYTTIPYAIETYKGGSFSSLMTSAFVAANGEQGKTVAEAMTADLTTVLNGEATLLYGNDCDGMRALAQDFRTALASLSADTGVAVTDSLAKLDAALAIALWHNADEAGVCTACGKTGLIFNEEVKVEAPKLEDIVDNTMSEEVKEAVKEVVDDIVANDSVAKVEDTGLTDTENEAVIEAAKEALIELGVSAEEVENVVPVVSIKLTEVSLTEGAAPAKVTYNVSPIVAVGDKSVKIAEFEKEITFRLPVHSAETKPYAKVYHEGDLIGTFDIITDGENKFVEISAKNFSEYAVEPTEEAPVQAVASVNGTGYATLAEAFAAAQNGDTIVLLSDVVLTSGVTVPAGKSVTLDLAGFDIAMTVGAVTKNTYVIDNNGTLTIKDSGEENGSITLTYTGANNGSVTISTIGNHGTLNVEGGWINCVAGNQNIAYAIDSYNSVGNAYVNVSGGIVYGGASNYYCVRLFLCHAAYENSLNVTGGTLWGVWAQNTNANANKGSLSVTGGSVEYVYVSAVSGSNDISNIALNLNADNMSYAPTVVVTGGSHELELVDGVYQIVDKSGVASINGVVYKTLAEAFAAAQSGDTIVLLSDVEIADTLTIEKSITLDGNGFKLLAVEGKTYNSAIMAGNSGWGDNHGETIKLVNLEISGFNTAYGAVRAQGVTLEMTDCVLNNNSVSNYAYAVVSLNYTYATISGCEFKNNNERVIDVNYNGDDSNALVTIDGCTFDGNKTTGAGIVMRSDGQIAVKNSVFANNTVSTNGNGATLYVGFGAGNEVIGCTFEGNSVTTSHATTKRFATAIFCDGCVVTNNVFGNNTAVRNGETITTVVAVGAYYGAADISGNYWNGSAPTPGVNFTIEYNRNQVDLNSYFADEELAEEVAINYVAKVGNYGYETLEEAFAAAQNGDTVVLLADITVESALADAAKGVFNIAADKKITLDLNGKTITAIDNSNGNFIVFYSYGEFTIKNGTVTLVATNNRAWGAQSTILMNRGGVLTIESGSYIHNGGTDMAITVDNNANSFGDAHLFINGGEVKSTYTALRMRMADPTLNGEPGNGAAYLEMTDGYLYGGSRGIWGQITNPSSLDLGALEITGGTIEGVNQAINIGTDAYSNISVAISGETVVKGIIKGEAEDFAITGGSFTTDVNDLCADGFKCEANEDGTFGITVASYEAKIGDVNYATLEEALAAAQSGDVIVLLADVDVDSVAKDGFYLGFNADNTKILVVSDELVSFKGASIRYQLADGTAKDYTSADIRFSYVFSSDFAFEAGSWGWNYKLGASKTGSKIGSYYDETGRTNLVFTNIAFENFEKEISTQLWFKVAVDGESFTVYDDYQVRTVKQVVDGVADYQGAGYETAKNYAIKLREEYEAWLASNEEEN